MFSFVSSINLSDLKSFARLLLVLLLLSFLMSGLVFVSDAWAQSTAKQREKAFLPSAEYEVTQVWHATHTEWLTVIKAFQEVERTQLPTPVSLKKKFGMLASSNPKYSEAIGVISQATALKDKIVKEFSQAQGSIGQAKERVQWFLGLPPRCHGPNWRDAPECHKTKHSYKGPFDESEIIRRLSEKVLNEIKKKFRNSVQLFKNKVDDLNLIQVRLAEAKRRLAPASNAKPPAFTFFSLPTAKQREKAFLPGQTFPLSIAGPAFTFSQAPPKKTVTGQDAGQINTDGTVSLNYLCNPDPKVKTGDLSRALLTEIDALHGKDAPSAPDLQSLEQILGQLKSRVTTLMKPYAKTPVAPKGSATLNDCYTDAEIEVFKSNFATVANAWINHKKLAGKVSNVPPFAP